MTVTYGFPSGTNTFVPSNEASGSVIYGYSRDPNKFAINRYLQRIAVPKREFYVAQWNSVEGARIRSANNSNLAGAEFVWGDGNEAPTGLENQESFTFQLFGTTRYAYPFTLGNLSVEQASFDLLTAQAGVVAQKAMTHRTLLAYNALNNAGFTTATATSLSGSGKFNVGTPSQPNCKIGLMAAAISINQSTMGTVDVGNLAILMNPNTATKIGASQEITDNMKFQAGLTYVLDGVPVEVNSEWGIPSRLYGFETIVEKTMINTAAKGGTNSLSYVIPDGTIIMLSKQGGLDGVYGSPSWSTLTGYFHEEFTVETMVDQPNRRTTGRVVTDFTLVVTDQGVKSGYIITAAI